MPCSASTTCSPSGRCAPYGRRASRSRLALGAMRTLREAGIATPDTIAVAGFDNIEDARFAYPTLTTVAPDVQFLATEAVRLLVRRTENPGAPAEQVEVPFTIEVRQSSAA